MAYLWNEQNLFRGVSVPSGSMPKDPTGGVGDAVNTPDSITFMSVKAPCKHCGIPTRVPTTLKKCHVVCSSCAAKARADYEGR